MEHTKIQESSQDEISQKQRILRSICSFYISKTELSTAKARETILTVNRLINLLTLGKLVLPNKSNAVPSIPVCVLQAVVEAMASKTPINSPVVVGVRVRGAGICQHNLRAPELRGLRGGLVPVAGEPELHGLPGGLEHL